MAEVHLAGEASQHVPALTQGDIEQDQDQEIEHILPVGDQRHGQRHHQQPEQQQPSPPTMKETRSIRCYGDNHWSAPFP